MQKRLSPIFFLGIFVGAVTGFANGRGEKAEPAPTPTPQHTTVTFPELEEETDDMAPSDGSTFGKLARSLLATYEHAIYSKLPTIKTPASKSAQPKDPKDPSNPSQSKADNAGSSNPAANQPGQEQEEVSQDEMDQRSSDNKPQWWDESKEDEKFEGFGDEPVWNGPPENMGDGIYAKAQESINNYAGNQGNGLLGGRPAAKRNRSYGKCYRHVKYILKASGCVENKSSLTGGQAKNAGNDLKQQGFRPIDVPSPNRAPQGAVVVYQCGEHGHIEWKGPDGFYSDYKSTSPLRCNNFQVYFKATSECTGGTAAAGL